MAITELYIPPSECLLTDIYRDLSGTWNILMLSQHQPTATTQQHVNGIMIESFKLISSL